jgi:signal transduction histidine kinase
MAAAPNGAARALVCSGLRGAPAERFALLSAVGSALSPILELCETGATGAAERQLTRLKFDLHDGPLQDVVLLGEDLRLFAGQLTTALARHPQRRRIIGRLDDLAAMLVALDGDLRRIASLLESPFLRSQSFSESLAQIASAFAQRTETIPEVNLQGDLDDLTDAQHITLLALIREALSNIREHSHASRVAITVASNADGVTATVFDDGEGFDPETALIKAAREGHLGLVGMHERVQVLGGTTRIDSRPGGPTVISVGLPPRPGADDAPVAL